MAYVTNFFEWARNMFKKFTETYDKSNNTFKVFQDNDTTVVVNTKTMRTGTARRRPNETFNKIIGIAVAYARYLNMEIPKELKAKPIGTLAAGTAFKFMASDASIYYVIGELPTNKSIICYCYGDKIRTVFKNVEVFVIN